MVDGERYYPRLAAAYLRGGPVGAEEFVLPPELAAPPLGSLTDADLARVVELGLAAGIRLHRFKRTQELPRVRQVIGTLLGLAPESLLDVGSGRGVFLWPLLEALPELPVTAVDRRAEATAWPAAVHRGGVRNLRAAAMDATRLGFPDRSFDVVTLLEVLEHIPEAGRALREVLRVARRFAVVSVPSREDDNPEHIHLFTEEGLVDMATEAGAVRCSVRHVRDHRLVVIRVDEG